MKLLSINDYKSINTMLVLIYRTSELFNAKNDCAILPNML